MCPVGADILASALAKRYGVRVGCGPHHSVIAKGARHPEDEWRWG